MVNEKSSMIPKKKKKLGETSDSSVRSLPYCITSSGVRSLPCIYHFIYLLLFNGGSVIILPCSTYYFIMTYYCT